MGDNHDVILPKRTRAYYFPSGVTTSLYGGTRLGIMMGENSLLHKIEIYSEVTILVQNITNYYRNEFVTFREVFSLDLGLAVGW